MSLLPGMLRILVLLLVLAGVWIWQWNDHRGQVRLHEREHAESGQAFLAAAEGVTWRLCRGGRYDPSELASTYEAMRVRLGSTWLALLDAEGNVLAESGVRPAPPDSSGAGPTVLRKSLESIRSRGRGQRYGRPDLVSLPASSIEIVLVYPRNQLDLNLSASLRRFLVTGMAITLCLALLTVLLWIRDRSSDLRARLATSRERVEALEFLGRLGAGLAHETKNPLGIVRGFAERLASEECDADTVRKSARSILSETDRTVARLDEFLLLSRPSKIRRARFPLEPFFAEIAELLEPDLAQKQATFEYPKSSVHIDADQEQMRRLFLNLLINASQALRPGGHVEIDHTWSLVGLEITVEDDGVGVPAEIRETLFQPYVSGRGSTGLGLAMADRIATSHGFDLRYEPGAGGGSRFIVSIPKS